MNSWRQTFLQQARVSGDSKMLTPEDPDFKFFQRLLRVGNSIAHCGDYGHIYWNPSTKTVWWVAADGDGVEGLDTPEMIIEKFKTIPGVEEVQVEDEAFPKGEGWIRVEQPHDNEPTPILEKPYISSLKLSWEPDENELENEREIAEWPQLEEIDAVELQEVSQRLNQMGFNTHPSESQYREIMLAAKSPRTIWPQELKDAVRAMGYHLGASIVSARRDGYLIKHYISRIGPRQQQQASLRLSWEEAFLDDPSWEGLSERQKKILRSTEYSGNLDLSHTPITNLGNLTRVGGDLNLRNTPIANLGNLTRVGGDLDLSDTPITNLGNLREVGGDLFLYETSITNLGNLTRVGGSLDLSDTPITNLGNLTNVGGDLDLYNTRITNLGNLTRVGGDLSLHNTPIANLGILEYVGGYLYLHNTPIARMNEGERNRVLSNVRVRGRIVFEEEE